MRSLNEWLNLGSITLEDRCTLLLCVRTKTIGIIAVIEQKISLIWVTGKGSKRYQISRDKRHQN